MKQALTAKGQVDVWKHATLQAFQTIGVGDVHTDDAGSRLSGVHPELGPINIDYLIPEEGKTRMEIQVENPELIQHFKGAVAGAFRAIMANPAALQAITQPAEQPAKQPEAAPAEPVAPATPETPSQPEPVQLSDLPKSKEGLPISPEAGAVVEPTEVIPVDAPEVQTASEEQAQQESNDEVYENTKICKHCKKPMPKNSDICPNCHKKQKSNVLPIVLGVVGGVIVLGLLAFFVLRPMFSRGGNNSGGNSGGGTSTPSTSTSTPSTSTDPNATANPSTSAATVKVSNAQYEQVQNGMTYDQVVGIMGGQGQQLSESTYNDSNGNPVTLKIYYWEGQGETGANVSITFQGDVVTTKSSYGLQ